jgi:hypothetical protein
LAKLPALCASLAKVGGKPRETIDHVARIIREAGYITTTKRGSGAAEMTARDAVNLLLGVTGADAPKGAPVAIDRFRSLRKNYALGRPKVSIDDRGTHHADYEPELEAFKAIAKAETFGDALELLLDGGIREILFAAFAFIEAGYPGTEHKAHRDMLRVGFLTRSWDAPFSFTVTLHRYFAEMSCKTWVGSSVEEAHWRDEFSAQYLVDAERFMAGFYGTGESGWRVSVTIDGQTFLSLYLALVGEFDEALPPMTEYS